MSADVVLEEVRKLRAEVAELTRVVSRGRVDGLVSTREAAALLGVRPRVFRVEHVPVNISPVDGCRSLFHRRDVEALADRVRSVRRYEQVRNLRGKK
jgi:hypothetical protein